MIQDFLRRSVIFAGHSLIIESIVPEGRGGFFYLGETPLCSNPYRTVVELGTKSLHNKRLPLVQPHVSPLLVVIIIHLHPST